MKYRRLLAKSGGRFIPGTAQTGREQTIREHTASVMEAAEALLKATGHAQLKAIGLDPDIWLEPFRRLLLTAAMLHDIGKASSSYQEMLYAAIAKKPPVRQAIRHEAISYLIARREEIHQWLRPLLGGTDDLELLLWSVAGHHRKFPPEQPAPGTGLEIIAYLTHPDFTDLLKLGSERLGLDAPPQFAEDLKLPLGLRNSVVYQFKKAEADAKEIMGRLVPDRRRFIAMLKACLIGADVAGSIGPQGDKSVAEWIAAAFGRVPTTNELKGIVQRRLDGKKLRNFQRQVGKSKSRVTFVRAGCGSGKTIAAYHWAARQAPGRRVFFCYPTTGTSTEGYRDYLTDPKLDADLVHGRSHVDWELFSASIQVDAIELGEDESGAAPLGPAKEGPKAGDDAADVVKQWSAPLVSCTVDSVLGLVQNNRRGVMTWPSIAGAACVFDEIHAFDDKLFEALVRFLVDVRGIPCLLMTASLPEARKRKLQEALAAIGEDLGQVDGPKGLERHPRYVRSKPCDAWELVEATLTGGGKVLWVVNTVDRALALAEDPRAIRHGAKIYHSRFRYIDRTEQHTGVIEAFKESGPALAITTQVAEMSLDLSADLLVTDLCPIPALIQRLGRLNRRATPKKPGKPKPFLVRLLEEGESSRPYDPADLQATCEWLDKLGTGKLSQHHLIANWEQEIGPSEPVDDSCIWLDGGFYTRPHPLRESSPGIDIILETDLGKDPAKVRIPMPPPPHKYANEWMRWPEYKFCKVPPDGTCTYNPTRGASWNR